MKKIQYILAGTMLVSLSLGAQAQTQPQDTTMNRTVVVEQEYNPDIMDASKVNVLPRVEPPTVSKKAVEYDATLMPATQIPAGIMQAYTGKETQAKALPGYVRLGYGNYGNLDVRANYLFSLSPKDTRTLYGAEAKYLVALQWYNAGNYASAEKEILNFIDQSTPYAYWLARSFILLSDVYVAMDKKLDARQYLLSLQQNYQADDDIASMINERLEKLK